MTTEGRDWKYEYEAEYRIVDSVWAALGIENYEQSKPLSIDEHVARLRESHERLLAIAKRAARCMNNDWPVKQDLVAAIIEAEKVSKP